MENLSMKHLNHYLLKKQRVIILKKETYYLQEVEQQWARHFYLRIIQEKHVLQDT